MMCHPSFPNPLKNRHKKMQQFTNAISNVFSYVPAWGRQTSSQPPSLSLQPSLSNPSQACYYTTLPSTQTVDLFPSLPPSYPNTSQAYYYTPNNTHKHIFHITNTISESLSILIFIFKYFAQSSTISNHNGKRPTTNRYRRGNVSFRGR